MIKLNSRYCIGVYFVIQNSDGALKIKIHLSRRKAFFVHYFCFFEKIKKGILLTFFQKLNKYKRRKKIGTHEMKVMNGLVLGLEKGG